MNTAPIPESYVRATLHNVAETTRSAHPPLRMPPRLRSGNTIANMGLKCALLTGAIALVLYLASRA